MAELLFRTGKQYAAACISRFAVKEICVIVSDMSSVSDKHNATTVALANKSANKSSIDLAAQVTRQAAPEEMVEGVVQQDTSLANTIQVDTSREDISQSDTEQHETIQSESKRLNGKLCKLLSKISAKDKTAFERFYDQTITLCFSQALRISRRDDIAEEVVSDVYMQVWNKASSYDEQRSGVMTWLMMICRSRALDALRKRKNQQAKESVSIDAIAEPYTDDDPQAMLSAVQQGNFLHSALLKLKPQQRQLLSLAYFQGLTHNEISNYTDIPLGTVKTQIRRAIIMLQELSQESELAACIAPVCSPEHGGKSHE